MKPTRPTQVPHTPLPWYLSSDGRGIIRNGKRFAEAYTKEDAAFIARAVNSHEELLEALKSCHVDCVTCEKSRLPCPYQQAVTRAEGK